MRHPDGEPSRIFLNMIGVPELKPATSPVDPGYDPRALGG